MLPAWRIGPPAVFPKILAQDGQQPSRTARRMSRPGDRLSARVVGNREACRDRRSTGGPANRSDGPARSASRTRSAGLRRDVGDVCHRRDDREGVLPLREAGRGELLEVALEPIDQAGRLMVFHVPRGALDDDERCDGSGWVTRARGGACPRILRNCCDQRARARCGRRGGSVGPSRAGALPAQPSSWWTSGWCTSWPFRTLPSRAAGGRSGTKGTDTLLSRVGLPSAPEVSARRQSNSMPVPLADWGCD